MVSNIFSIIYGIILPIDELHHFSRWLKPATTYIYIYTHVYACSKKHTSNYVFDIVLMGSLTDHLRNQSPAVSKDSDRHVLGECSLVGFGHAAGSGPIFSGSEGGVLGDGSPLPNKKGL